jgi:secretion/DNA translocation related CpaE-like protein
MASPRMVASPPVRPLVVTSDGELLDELLRLATATRVEVDVAADAVAARSRFSTAALVLVGADCAAACARARLPRRPGVVLTLTAAGEPGEATWQLADAIGAEQVAALPAAEPWLARRLEGLMDGAPRPAGVVAVLGGRGGAGASVLSAGLAVTAARAGLRALLVDADPLGGGADLVLGWEALDGLRWPALSVDAAVPASGLVAALPNRGELAVLSADRAGAAPIPAGAMAAVLEAGRTGRDLLVADLPRRLDDAAALALQSADRTLLVVPAELRACAAASRVAEAATAYTATVQIVVRGPAPGRLRAREIARAIGLPLAGMLRAEPALPAALERGEPPAGTGTGPLAALCQRVLSELGYPAGAVAV